MYSGVSRSASRAVAVASRPFSEDDQTIHPPGCFRTDPWIGMAEGTNAPHIIPASVLSVMQGRKPRNVLLREIPHRISKAVMKKLSRAKEKQ